MLAVNRCYHVRMPASAPDPIAAHHHEWTQIVSECLRDHRGYGLKSVLRQFGEVSPPSWRWSSVAEGILRASPLVQPRAALLKIWADQPGRPELSAKQVNQLLLTALANHAVACLPLLAGLGATATADSKAAQLLARELKAGRWAYPDLLLPNVTADHGYQGAIVDGLFTPLSLSRPAFATQMVRLASDPLLTKKISRRIARMRDALDRLSPEKSRPLYAVIATLAQANWVDPEEVRREAAWQTPSSPGLEACLALIERVQLERDTVAELSPPAARPRLRL